MEKIYMEENKNQKQKKSVIDSSVVLSFVVSIFAIVSLAMFGIISNQDTDISYALPDEATQLKVVEEKDSQNRRISINGEGAMEVEGIGSVPTNISLFKYTLVDTTSQDQQQIFCIEQTKGAEDNAIHEAQTEGTGITLSAEDQKVVSYIMLANVSGINADSANAKYAITWVKQAAIWTYLDKEGAPASMRLSQEDRDAIAHTSKITYISEGVTDPEAKTTVYTGDAYKLVTSLIAEAKQSSDLFNSKLELSKDSDDFTAVKDENGNISYYQSSLISVVSSANLVEYDIELEDGIDAYDEDGKKLENPVQSTQKFYVRIPADKVKYPDSKKVEIGVKAKFAVPETQVYQAAESPDIHQRLVGLSSNEKEISKGIEVVVTPDTGVNATQTIYFIGLIVLLCGVGIVYANAKPVQSKQ